MRKKFEFPSTFTLINNEGFTRIKIDGENPIWTWSSIVFVVVCVGLSYFSLFTLIGGVIGVVRFFIEKGKKTIIDIYDDHFVYNEKRKFDFIDIENIFIKTERGEALGSMVQSTTYHTKSIKIKLINGQVAEIAKNLIDDYQQVLSYTLRQCLGGNEAFIQKYLR